MFFGTAATQLAQEIRDCVIGFAIAARRGFIQTNLYLYFQLKASVKDALPITGGIILHSPHLLGKEPKASNNVLDYILIGFDHGCAFSYARDAPSR